MTVAFILVFLATVCLFGSMVCVALCLKIYTEMMKEHTIRRRYESQGPPVNNKKE